jgi:hypothetical protein
LNVFAEDAYKINYNDLTMDTYNSIGNGDRKSSARNCSFFTVGHHSKGYCTFFGACRVDSIDYMYRGDCGELSLWGEKEIKEKEVRDQCSNYCKCLADHYHKFLASLLCLGGGDVPEPWPVYQERTLLG